MTSKLACPLFFVPLGVLGALVVRFLFLPEKNNHKGTKDTKEHKEDEEA